MPTPIPRWRRALWPFWEPDFWSGRRLDPTMIDEWRKHADDFFPPNPINFFVQHKRPHQTAEQGASGEYWKQAYYEFKINAQQQARLEALERNLGPSGVVTYACAAFLSKSQLWQHSQTADIVGNSNFISAGKLTGHTRYTFIEPGHVGHANADPTPIEDKPLLERLVSAGERSEGLFSAQIKRAGRAVNEMMAGEDTDTESLYQTLLNRLFDGLDTGDLDDDLSVSLARVLAFNAVNSTTWTIVTAPKS